MSIIENNGREIQLARSLREKLVKSYKVIGERKRDGDKRFKGECDWSRNKTI